MRNKKIIVAILLLLALTSVTRAGWQDEGILAVKTGDGVLLIWNHPGHHFTLRIKGHNIRPLDSTELVFFEVDGTIFQVQVANTDQFLKPAAKNNPDNASILAAHKDWESQYIEKTLGKKLNVQASPLKLKSGKDALLWMFDMPEGVKSDAKKQLYLAVVTGNGILLLNSIVNDKNNEQIARQLLIETMETLKESTKPINVKEEQEKIRRNGE